MKKAAVIVPDKIKVAIWFLMLKERPVADRPYEFTNERLKPVIVSLMRQDWFWQELVGSHDLLKMTPAMLKNKRPKEFENMSVWFWNTVTQLWTDLPDEKKKIGA